VTFLVSSSMTIMKTSHCMYAVTPDPEDRLDKQKSSTHFSSDFARLDRTQMLMMFLWK
jgi:hypothetical protein